MKRHPLAFAVLTATLASTALAQSVAYTGSFGNKALLVVNGGAPRAIAPGETHDGVKLISANSDQATVEIKGKRLTVALGGAPSSVGGAGERQTTVLKTDSSGHFVTTAQVNGTGIRFLVDTGATLVVLSREDADRARIAYKDAPVGVMQTANGPVQAWRVKIDRLRVGEIEINNVDAVVNATPLPFGLLGMSFLSRTEMKRNGEEMTLIKRF
jgi:aspartyl protease family protein